MTPEETTTVARPEAEAEAVAAEDALEAEDEAEEEDFNPLGHIEGWSAFECSSGPFGHRG
jgi:hypothetical protein